MSKIKYDGLVKSPIQPIIVIPVKTGIQFLCMVPCFRRGKSGLLLEFIPMQIGAGVTD